MTTVNAWVWERTVMTTVTCNVKSNCFSGCIQTFAVAEFKGKFYLCRLSSSRSSAPHIQAWLTYFMSVQVTADFLCCHLFITPNTPDTATSQVGNSSALHIYAVNIQPRVTSCTWNGRCILLPHKQRHHSLFPNHGNRYRDQILVAITTSTWHRRGGCGTLRSLFSHLKHSPRLLSVKGYRYLKRRFMDNGLCNHLSNTDFQILNPSGNRRRAHSERL